MNEFFFARGLGCRDPYSCSACSAWPWPGSVPPPSAQSLGFRVSSSGFGVQSFLVWAPLGLRKFSSQIVGLGLNQGCRSLVFRVLGLRFWVSGFGFWVEG